MSKTLKELMAEKLITEDIKNHISINGTCPRYYDVLNISKEKIVDSLKISNIPSVDYLDDTSASDLTYNINLIKSWIELSAESLKPIIKEYADLSIRYNSLSSRIFNETIFFKEAINRMLNPSCYYVSTRMSNQTKESNCGKIGKFIMLPFYIASTKIYNDKIFLSMLSSGSVVFSNISSVKELPLKEMISIKIQGMFEEELTFNCVLNNTITGNALYFKMLNTCKKLTLHLRNGETTVYTKEYNDSEIFANFIPVSFDNIVINIKYNNTNTDKPFSLQIYALEIFENIQFSKIGFFESKEIDISNSTEISNLGLVFTENNSKSLELNTRNMISVSTTSDSHDYNFVEPGETIDITTSKFRHYFTYNQFDIDANEVVEMKYQDDNSERLFYKFLIDKNVNTDLWYMDYSHALMFHGLQKQYARTTQSYSPSPDLIYENWSKVGVYWKTMCVVNEENVVLDIGKNKCKINGKSETGKINIPTGILTLEVHEKDIDFKLGQVTKNNVDVTNQTSIYSDPLFPFNFAYLFSGLPDFTTDGVLSNETDRTFSVSGGQIRTIILGESFLPLTMDISDSQGNVYDLVLTNGVSKKGTFSLEPNTGKVKIYVEDGATSISLQYRRANPFRRPIGIMFNRLLTFMPIKTLIGLNWRDDMFFSLDGGPNDRSILIQDIPNQRIVHSQIIFNRYDNNIYTSAKIHLETVNRYITPILSDIYITAE